MQYHSDYYHRHDYQHDYHHRYDAETEDTYHDNYGDDGEHGTHEERKAMEQHYDEEHHGRGDGGEHAEGKAESEEEKGPELVGLEEKVHLGEGDGVPLHGEAPEHAK